MNCLPKGTLHLAAGDKWIKMKRGGESMEPWFKIIFAVPDTAPAHDSDCGCPSCIEAHIQKGFASTETDILEEALSVTKGDRQADYGDMTASFTRIASLWSAYKGVEFTAKDVASMMILLKVSRSVTGNKRDNWVDIAGYARCGSIVSQKPTL